MFDHHLEPGRPHPDAYDEVFHPDGTVRPPYRALDEAIAPTAAADLKVRSEALDRACVDQGVTFSLSGQERPFPLVIVPKVARVLSKEPTPVDAVHAACRRVHEHLTHQRGTTGVHTSAQEAWEAGKGVCQDYVHLTLLLLREAGVPARYVSGYLLPDAQAEVRQTVTGESHAWIEAWTGGWWGYDPTNLIDISNRHVWVATGRDYADVPPLKGIYSGGTASALDVTVAMTRLA